MAFVEMESVTKIFDDGGEEIVAVDDINLEIRDGEFLVLVGPSGCGKSTTLRCIAGLESVTAGDIRIGGESVVGLDTKKRNVAMVFQEYALYPHLTARQNIKFPLKVGNNTLSEDPDQLVKETAETLGITDELDQKPGELSGGQQQRVALGRAMVRDPDIFLMDEPLSNLDAKLRARMRTEIKMLQQDLDVTTIYVTHNQTEAMTLGDRIVVMDGGIIQQIGSPLECYHQPNNQFVASFIGSPSMNFIDVSFDYDRKILTNNDFSYSISEKITDKLGTVNDELVLGIRPEDIEIAGSPEEGDLTVVVDIVEPNGDITYVEASSNGLSLTFALDGHQFVSPDSEITIVIPENDIHLFDGDSGTKIEIRDDKEGKGGWMYQKSKDSARQSGT